MQLEKFKFYKMNGLGNEFVIIDNSKKNLEIDDKLIKLLSAKSTGLGFDQIISIDKVNKHKIDIRIWNSDTRPAQACGNASRCIAKLFFELRDYKIIEINTGVIKHTCKKLDDDQIIVNMGQPITYWKDIPTSHLSENTLKFDYDFDIKELKNPNLPSLINVGNPHIIFWLDNIEKISFQVLGPIIENHKIFPDRINVSFAQIINLNKIKLVVWERGAGLTKACGTAAAAVAYASYKLSMTNPEVSIQLPGGLLKVNIDADDYIYKSGPAELEYTDYYNSENINEK
jgi:diaminopimelate epimerase